MGGPCAPGGAALTYSQDVHQGAAQLQRRVGGVPHIALLENHHLGGGREGWGRGAPGRQLEAGGRGGFRVDGMIPRRQACVGGSGRSTQATKPITRRNGCQAVACPAQSRGGPHGWQRPRIQHEFHARLGPRILPSAPAHQQAQPVSQVAQQLVAKRGLQLVERLCQAGGRRGVHNAWASAVDDEEAQGPAGSGRTGRVEALRAGRADAISWKHHAKCSQAGGSQPARVGASPRHQAWTRLHPCGTPQGPWLGPRCMPGCPGMAQDTCLPGKRVEACQACTASRSQSSPWSDLAGGRGGR